MIDTDLDLVLTEIYPEDENISERIALPEENDMEAVDSNICLLYTSPSPRDRRQRQMCIRDSSS